MYLRFGKRVFDLLLASFLLLLSLPVLLIVDLALAVANFGQVFFFQQRPGLNGKPFWIYKFKTMTDERDKDGELLSDEQRLTWLGRWVRTLSLDELLQFINVVKGEMSLVGPRPLLMEYLPRYSAYQARRHEVRPGITGLAQVRGRNATTWRRRLRYDVFYVKHCSLPLDLFILWKTFLVVFKMHGISSGTSETMEIFRGNPERK